MAGRKIYLCRIYNAELNDHGVSFFNCDHHFQDTKENLKRNNFAGRIDKIVEVKNEVCEKCLGDKYNEQFKKSRKRAEEVLFVLKEQVDEDFS